jgi:hypothetical protein
MLALVFGGVVLILLLLAIQSFSKADPKRLARVLRYIGGGAALLITTLLFLRGQIGPAVSIGLVGLGVLGYVSLWPASVGARTQKSPGQISRVRTAFLEMELDHDSGAIRGRVINGEHQGAALDDLDAKTLVVLLRETLRRIDRAAFADDGPVARTVPRRRRLPPP